MELLKKGKYAQVYNTFLALMVLFIYRKYEYLLLQKPFLKPVFIFFIFYTFSYFPVYLKFKTIIHVAQMETQKINKNQRMLTDLSVGTGNTRWVSQ